MDRSYWKNRLETLFRVSNVMPKWLEFISRQRVDIKCGGVYVLGITLRTVGNFPVFHWALFCLKFTNLQNIR